MVYVIVNKIFWGIKIGEKNIDRFKYGVCDVKVIIFMI